MESHPLAKAPSRDYPRNPPPASVRAASPTCSKQGFRDKDSHSPHAKNAGSKQ